MNGLAVAALALATTSCHKDLGGGLVYDKEQQMANAELQLGVQIDPNQTWKMTAEATANVAINLDYGETYTVKIYSNDPLYERKGYVLASGTIKNGEIFKKKFSYSSGSKDLMIGVKDSKGHSFFKNANIIDGQLNTTIGSVASETRSAHRSMSTPTVPDINIPTELVNTIKNQSIELTTENNDVNAPGYKWWQSSTDKGMTLYNNYVIHYKITGEWEGQVNQLSSVGKHWTGNWVANPYYGEDPEETYEARTLYVSGKWTIPSNVNQTAGQGSNLTDGPDCIVIVDNGGEIEINGTFDMSNEARLIVMPGGKITGTGSLKVNNGNSEGNENYNGGYINVGTFNNNFGKFYNYGTFKATEYQAGGQESNFYNHGVVNIDHSAIYESDYYTNKKAPNGRIFNACQWYCAKDMSARNIEMTSGSYMYVGRELILSASQDGTSDPTYVSLAEGSLMHVEGWLDNNQTIWQGPSSGYAVVELGKIKYLNWDGDGPLTSGYFANNIAVSVDKKDNNCLGKTSENAYNAFVKYVANGKGVNGNTTEVGNGGVVMVDKGHANVIIPASTDDEGRRIFKAGEKGCTPGYGITYDEDGDDNHIEEVNLPWSYAFEDTPVGDYDMNDVVIKVSEDETDNTKLNLKFVASGATLDLYVRLYNNHEVYGDNNPEHYRTLVNPTNQKSEIHDMFNVERGKMINTQSGVTAKPFIIQIEKGDYNPANLPIAIFADNTQWGEVHLAGAGETPHGVIIPDDWKWPTERTIITSAYDNKSTSEGDQSFATYASDANGAANWFKYPTQKVMNEATLGY